MDVASDKTPAGGRKPWVQAVFILVANLVVAASVSGMIAALTGANAYHPKGVSQGFAALLGWWHVSFGATAAAMRASARFLDDAEEAEELRREGRALLLGAGALIAAGASLILLSLVAPGGPVSPAAGLIGALALNVLATVLVAIRWRQLDELNRTIAREAGYLAFGWLSMVGGTWVMLAHTGFVPAPAPLDWLSMLGGSSFIAGLVALARRGGFQQR